MLQPRGLIVLSIRSDDPGLWLFHCHIEWRVDIGLIATTINATLQPQKTLTIPKNHDAAFADSVAPISTAAKAAARRTDLLKVQCVNIFPAPLSTGFAARDIVALVFSVIAAFLDMPAVSWYGMRELSLGDLEHTKRIAQAGPVGIRVVKPKLQFQGNKLHELDYFAGGTAGSAMEADHKWGRGSY